MGRVLIIEDDQDLVELLAFRLRRRGHEVCVAYDGSEGYFAALQEQPDVILLDILLPGFTGHELLHMLRTNPDVGRVPVLVMSALDPSGHARDSRERADDYLTKPFDLDRLVARVDDMLRGTSARVKPGAAR